MIPLNGMSDQQRTTWRHLTLSMGMSATTRVDALAFAKVLEIEGAVASADSVRKHANTLGNPRAWLKGDHVNFVAGGKSHTGKIVMIKKGGIAIVDIGQVAADETISGAQWWDVHVDSLELAQ